jgi:hypothetical protein
MFVHQCMILTDKTTPLTGWALHPSGFSSDPDEACELADLLGELDEYYLLGSDELPAEIVDIRGNIRNEPTYVYYYVSSVASGYFGLEDANI